MKNSLHLNEQSEQTNSAIRTATIEDVPQITKINVDCWQNNYKGLIDDEYLNTIDIDKKTKNWIEYFKKGETFYLIKEIDGKIAGFIDGHINTDSTFPYDFEINGLYIDRQYQGKGIGKELFNELIIHEKFNKYKSFYLFTLKDNIQSRGFYEKMGGKVFTELQKEWGGKSYTLVGYKREK